MPARKRKGRTIVRKKKVAVEEVEVEEEVKPVRRVLTEEEEARVLHEAAEKVIKANPKEYVFDLTSRANKSVDEQIEEVAAGMTRSRLAPMVVTGLEAVADEADGGESAAVYAGQQAEGECAEAGEWAEELKRPLYWHQLQAIDWMVRMETKPLNVGEAPLKGGILADEMGLGKTLTTLAMVIRRAHEEGGGPRAERLLVVCPMSCMEQWEHTVKHFTHGNVLGRTIVYHGQARRKCSVETLAAADMVVTSYDTLASEMRQGEVVTEDGLQMYRGRMGPVMRVNWRRVVLDEAHLIRNSSSRRRRAAVTVNADFRWCLTGTPINNNVNDLHALVKFLRWLPFAIDKYWARFVCSRKSGKSGHVPPAVKMITKVVLLRRRKSDMINGRPIVELPPKNVEAAYHEFADTDEMAFYRAIEERSRVQFNRFLKAGTVLENYCTVLALLMRMRRAAVHPHLVAVRFAVNADDATGPPPGAAALSMDQLLSDAVPPSAKTAVADITAYVREHPECPICYDVVTQPVRLGCSHLICLECLEAHVTTGSNGDKCPMCGVAMAPNSAFMLHKLRPLKEFGLPGEEGPDEVVKDESADSEPTEDAGPPPFSTKCAIIVSRVRAMLADHPGCKGIIVSQWTSALDLVEGALDSVETDFVRYDGTMSANARNEALQVFRDDPTVTLLLLSMRAGGVGLNLNVANYMWVMDPWYNPQIINQVVDRVHRIGQTRPVHVERVLISDTVEERIELLQAAKMRMANEVLDEDGVSAAGHQDARYNMQQLRYLFNDLRNDQPINDAHVREAMRLQNANVMARPMGAALRRAADNLQ